MNGPALKQRSGSAGKGTPALKQRSGSAHNSPLWKRLAWMAAIWATSVSVLGAVGYVLRLWLAP